MNIKHILRSIRIRLFHKRNPNIWVFGAWMGNSYNDNPKELFEYVSNNCPNIHAYWVTKSNVVFDYLKNKGFKVELFGSKNYFTLLENAGLFIYNIYNADIVDAKFSYYIRDAAVLHTSHGMPIKKAYLDTPNVKKPSKLSLLKKELLIFLGLKGKQYNICTSDFFKPITYSQFMNKRILVEGTPRLDILFSKKESSYIKNLKSMFPKGVRFILYMPTFRSAIDDGVPFSPFSQFGFDMRQMDEMLQRNNMVFLNKAHFYDNNIDDGFHSDRFITIENSPTLDIYDILKDVDILATDYSSIYTDFALINKPIILTPFDYSDYIKNYRELYFDYKLWASKVVYNWTDFISAIDKSDYWSLPEDRVALFHKYRDGKTSERLVKTMSRILKIK